MNRDAAQFGRREAELVRQAQRGDPDAFAELVARYQDRVYNTCYRLCHDHADALDLTQTTFLKALESLPRFESRSGFHTWLFRIAVNLALSGRRRSARDPKTPLENPGVRERASEAAGRANSVARQLEQLELQQRVEAALAGLDPELRAAVVLKDIEDLDYASIAEILDVPIGTVKSRIHRGRLALREMLSDQRTELDAR